MNQELFVCMCAPVCNLFRAPRNRCAYFCVREIVCMCVIDVLVMRGLNAAKSSNCEKKKCSPGNFVFPYCCMSPLKFTLFFFYYILCFWIFHTSAEISGVITYLHAFDFTGLYKSPLSEKLSFLLQRPTCTWVCVYSSCLQLNFLSVYFLECRLTGKVFISVNH